jgi:hypothetical protein
MNTKIESLDAFGNDYRALSEGERNLFSKVAGKLLAETFLVKSKDTDKADFYFVSENKSAFVSFFEMLDYSLLDDPVNGLFYIQTNADRNRLRLSKFDTAIILILRRLYYEEKKEVTSDERTLVSLDAIMGNIRSSQIFKDEKRPSAYEASLRKLRAHKIINYSAKKLDETTTIEIYPSILVVVPSDSLEALSKRILLLKGEGNNDQVGGSDNENADEDQAD